MLLYSIKKPIKTLYEEAQERWRNRQAQQALPPPPVGEMTVPWDKMQFMRWMNQHVYGRYAVKDLLTYEYIPDQENKVPVHMELMHINEMHHLVKWDRYKAEPKVLCCRNQSGNIVDWAPSSVRKLTAKEIELVNLQNTQAQGSA
jgi:hypothetical protein